MQSHLEIVERDEGIKWCNHDHHLFCISSLNKTHWCCTSLHSWNSTRWQNRSCIDPNKAIDGICKQWNGWWKSWPIPWVKFNSLNYETSWVWWIYPSLKTRMQIQRVHNLWSITWHIIQVFKNPCSSTLSCKHFAWFLHWLVF